MAEIVLELHEYFDGPRAGVANFHGKPHSFKSHMADIYGSENQRDVFELVPVGEESAPVLARGDFRAVRPANVSGHGWPEFEVCWSPISRVSG